MQTVAKMHFFLTEECFIRLLQVEVLNNKKLLMVLESIKMTDTVSRIGRLISMEVLITIGQWVKERLHSPYLYD